MSAERRAAVEAAVAHSVDLAERLAAMRASALPYGAAFERQVLEPVPPELRVGPGFVKNPPHARLSG